MSRAVKEIIKDLCVFDPISTSLSLGSPNNRYMIFIGGLSNPKHFDELKKRVDRQKYFDDKATTKSNLAVMEAEEMEFFLEYVTIDSYTSVENFADYRKHYFINEDYFNPALLGIIEKQASLEHLRKVCYDYEAKIHGNHAEIMDIHDHRIESSASYFEKIGLLHDDAHAATLALSFYIGREKDDINHNDNSDYHQIHTELITKSKENINKAAIILYYLVKALSYIPCYWGYVTRSIQLTDDELRRYISGSLITWVQFSRSKKSREPIAKFKFGGRNTLFKIYSITGRPIGQFSNFLDDDEVLFLPHSTFFVFRRDINNDGALHIIYMRQVELGLCEWSVLWVDDKIFDERWQNKSLIENATARGINSNVHFIPKSSTESALSFLRSPFGQRLKDQETFRIITDMNRRNEKPAHNAGARFIKEVRRLGFENACLIFTSEPKKAHDFIHSELSPEELRRVIVATQTNDVEHFIKFQEISKKTTESKFEHPNEFNTNQQSTHPKPSPSLNHPAPPIPETYQEVEDDQHYEIPMDTNNGMMHNAENTDIKILIKNCRIRRLADSRDNCVLLTTGSFNPVHPCHIENLLQVREYLEHMHQPSWNVLAAYISPTHDDYVHSKLGERSWIPSKDRCQLCEDVIKHEGEQISSWISVSRGESEWSGGFVDFGPVAEHFRDFINNTLVGSGKPFKYPIRVVYVCGLDHYNKCSYVEYMGKQKNMACAVVCRVGYDEKQVARSMKRSDVIYIPLSKERSELPDVSSTEIRRYFENPSASKTNIKKFIYRNVAEYMSRKYKK